MPGELDLNGSFHGLAFDFALVPRRFDATSHLKRMGNREGNFAALEPGIFDRPIIDAGFAVRGAGAAERAGQRSAVELEFQGALAGTGCRVGGGQGDFPGAGGIDGRLSGPDGLAGDGEGHQRGGDDEAFFQAHRRFSG